MTPAVSQCLDSWADFEGWKFSDPRRLSRLALIFAVDISRKQDDGHVTRQLEPLRMWVKEHERDLLEFLYAVF